MAETSHGFHIPESNDAVDIEARRHFQSCLECRREVGEHSRSIERVGAMRRHPAGSRLGDKRSVIAQPTGNIRPTIWEEKTNPVEVMPIRPDNIHDVARWCGAQVVENPEARTKDEQYELRLPSFDGLLIGETGSYVLRDRHTGVFDIWKKAAFEEKYRQVGLRGVDR